MSNQSTLQEFLELAKNSKHIAVYQEILADDITPISVFTALKDYMVSPTLLESGEKRSDTGRYSFLGFNPFAEFIAKNKKTILRVGNKDINLSDSPLNALRQTLQKYQCVNMPHHLGFIGGAVGFISYDAIRFFEEIPNRHEDIQNIPDLFFSFYSNCVIFDHQFEKLTIVRAVEIDGDLPSLFHDALNQIQKLINQIKQPKQNSEETVSATQNNKDFDVQIDITDEEYRNIVEKAKQYIIKGDAFQIVASRCFKQEVTVAPFEIYRALRRTSPAPYMFYLDRGDYVIIGASPEKLISVQNKKVTTHPIAGTRPRQNPDQDEMIAAELMAAEKDRAEHIMLVDLGRNDIGKVCKPGTVKVTEFAQAKKFSHVFHLVSVVEGELAEQYDALDALSAALPAGTLSGAPKIRAMEIIDELETSRRGLYGGAICSIDNAGNLDSCIAIRMAVLRDGIATIRAGGGIVYDSDPQAEADETRHKAKTVLDAIAFAERRSL